jgi:2-aminoadipate transaminase
MIGPSDVIDAVVRLKQAVDLHTSGLSQQVVLHLLRQREWFDAHVAAITASYRERAAALSDALERELGSRVSISDPDGGMFLWLTSRPDTAPLDTRALLPLAIQAGTAFVPGGAFAVDEPLAAGRRPHSGSMRLSFATAAPAELEVAARRLACAIDQFDGRSRPRMSRGPLSQVK